MASLYDAHSLEIVKVSPCRAEQEHTILRVGHRAGTSDTALTARRVYVTGLQTFLEANKATAVSEFLLFAASLVCVSNGVGDLRDS